MSIMSISVFSASAYVERSNHFVFSFQIFFFFFKSFLVPFLVTFLVSIVVSFVVSIVVYFLVSFLVFLFVSFLVSLFVSFLVSCLFSLIVSFLSTRERCQIDSLSRPMVCLCMPRSRGDEVQCAASCLCIAVAQTTHASAKRVCALCLTVLLFCHCFQAGFQG